MKEWALLESLLDFLADDDDEEDADAEEDDADDALRCFLMK